MKKWKEEKAIGKTMPSDAIVREREESPKIAT
jgi:hypothetical protein